MRCAKIFLTGSVSFLNNSLKPGFYKVVTSQPQYGLNDYETEIYINKGLNSYKFATNGTISIGDFKLSQIIDFIYKLYKHKTLFVYIYDNDKLIKELDPDEEIVNCQIDDLHILDVFECDDIFAQEAKGRMEG